MAFYIKNSDFKRGKDNLMCKRNCGYFGNPEWNGLCSLCWRQFSLEANVRPAHYSTSIYRSSEKQRSPYLNSQTDSGDKESLSFARFQEKKKQQKERRRSAVKSMFIPTIKSGESSQNAGASSDSADGDLKRAAKEFNEFLSTMPKVAVNEIAEQVQKVADKVTKQAACDENIEELSKCVVDFLEYLYERMRQNANFKQLNAEEKEKAMDHCETYIQMRAYRHIFCPPSTNDEEKDIELQSKIRSLNWVSSHHLGAAIDEIDPAVRAEIDAAISIIFEMDIYKSSSAKLKCIVTFCQKISQILELCGNGPASADLLLPAVILIIIRANPARLHSNIKFITRFSNPMRLRSGEGGYFFTNLCCAVSFIEQINAEALDMTEDEFQKYMSGEAIAGHGALFGKEPILNEGIATIKQDSKLILKLTERTKNIALETENLLNDLNLFESQYISRVYSSMGKPIPLSAFRSNSKSVAKENFEQPSAGESVNVASDLIDLESSDEKGKQIP